MTEGRALSRFLTCVTLLRGALNLKQTVAMSRCLLIPAFGLSKSMFVGHGCEGLAWT